MMLYGRFVHVVPFLAVGLLEACGAGGATAGGAPAATLLAAGVPQPAAAARDFDLLPYQPVSGITTAQQVVVRDAAEFGTLWAKHMRNRVPVPPVPAVDFTSKMVVGVFAGELAHGCGGASINHVSYAGARLTVAYSVSTAMPEVCSMVMGSPAALAVVDRTGGEVEFVKVGASPVALSTVDITDTSLYGLARNAVVKDQAAWDALWAEHKGAGSAAPAVDFTRNIVVASFHGPGAGCSGLKLSRALRSGSVVTVQRTVSVPAPGVACAQMLKTPAHLVTLERTDDQIVFATEKVAY